MNRFLLLIGLALILIFGWIYFAFNTDVVPQEIPENEVATSTRDEAVVSPSMYTDPDGAFSVVLPSIATVTTEGYRVDESYENQQSPELIIDGIKFTIPASMASGTNLSSDTYISVENLPNAETCTADLFFDGEHVATTSQEGTVAYSVATSSNAGAGNRYDETVFALLDSKQCTAVRYVIHYGNFENYEERTVTEFNANALMSEFDAIRRTLVLKK